MSQERKKMSKGCMVALIIVGAMIVLLAITMIVCYVYRDELVGYGVTKMTEAASTQIKTDLPEGYTDAGVDSIMVQFQTAFKDKKIDSNEMQEISNKLQDLMKKENYTPEKGKEFLELLKKSMEE